MQKNWRELIKPKKLEVDDSTLTDGYGKFTIEPLERGFGITLGNSLRRILMSSLRGAAITKVRIDGVLHEFSSIPGIKEDVSEIILNLKLVKLKMDGDGPMTLKVKLKGPCDFTAGDIETDANVEILNKDLLIATLSKDAKLDCELTVETDKGYVPAHKTEDLDESVDTIPIDAVFNPVTRVNYEVSDARVGQRTDYDRLALEVWTTGSIDPQSVVAVAAKILKDQLSVFITFEEAEEVAEEQKEERPALNENLFKTVEELELSVRSANCLKNANIKYIGEMVKKTDQEMLKTKNFGRKSLNEIKELLHAMGLDFGMKVEGFPTRKELDELTVEKTTSL
ncbi:MAG: DNA-directed RNA polymerase subunit alpha [Thermodesulfobacteriota bacterium]